MFDIIINNLYLYQYYMSSENYKSEKLSLQVKIKPKYAQNRYFKCSEL